MDRSNRSGRQQSRAATWKLRSSLISRVLLRLSSRPHEQRLRPSHPSLFPLITIWRSRRVWADPLTAVLTGPQTIRARRKVKPCPLRCCRARSASAEFVSILLQRKNQTPSCRTDKRSLCRRENTIAFICWRPRRITTRKPCSSLETQRLTCLSRNGPALWANGTIESGRQLNSRYRRPRALRREPRRAFARINTVKWLG